MKRFLINYLLEEKFFYAFFCIAINRSSSSRSLEFRLFRIRVCGQCLASTCPVIYRKSNNFVKDNRIFVGIMQFDKIRETRKHKEKNFIPHQC